ncbi:hypothetical protein ES319_A11G166500v1 [Gossypium barbadense]|uniref:VQ domain-containing protein n=1 Tax=Gossypium barbadense TaxID=3634 RepID=A0A5J5TNW5_GOSBA|nr:hypothetical protein ES319_A11G166500v1 [Gossypium barbadense]
MSETVSTPTDWPQFYDHALSNQEIPNRVRVLTAESVFGDQGSDTAVLTTPTVTSSSAPVSLLGSGRGGGLSGGHLSPEGRVGKPVRRRSRASRRIPTTLLNTDTTNFRAMVQQFTGGPSAPFAGGAPHHGGPNFGFGFGTRHQPHNSNPNNPLMLPPTGFHLQYQQQQQQHQNQLIHHQNQPLMFSLNSNDNNPAPGELFFQRLGVGGGVNMQGSDVSSQVPPSRTSTSSSNDNRSNPRLMF